MRFLGYLTLSPWVSALIILFLDAMPAFLNFRLKDAFEEGKVDEDDPNLRSIVNLVLIINGLMILSYLIGGHWGGSIVLFVIGLLIYIAELMQSVKKKRETL